MITENRLREVLENFRPRLQLIANIALRGIEGKGHIPTPRLTEVREICEGLVSQIAELLGEKDFEIEYDDLDLLVEPGAEND